MIETRSARHDRRRMAQRRQHVAIAAEIAERRGLIDQRIRIVGIGGERIGIPIERRLQPLPPAHQIRLRSEEHTSELQSLMRISYAVFCLKKKNKHKRYAKATIATYRKIM